MVSVQENETMTRIGPGTKAGALLRRYWHPIAPVAELEKGEPKRRIRLLGEDLLLFRDGKGRVGLVQEQCAHRRASLYYGFVEEDGLRCAYHGWKYDVAGKCIEQPFEPAGSPLKEEACQGGYEVQQLAGLYWAYLGPKPAPLLPRWEVLVGNDGARRINVLPVLDCNWLQCMENSVDTVHTHYLHGQMMRALGYPERAAYYARPLEGYDFEVVKDPTWAGVRKIRMWGGQEGQEGETELGHPLIFPCTLLAPQEEHLVMHFRVPMDDTHTLIIRVQYTPGTKPLAPGEDPPVVYSPAWKDAKGDYDLRTFAAQDGMAWETEGAIHDRSKELLGVSDRGIVLYRRMLMEQIEAVAAGREPLGLIRDAALNREIRVAVSEGQARMARAMKRAG
jgi:5,5'-dehydrodivanillate O-demethylase oxygenase subunit